MAYVTLFLGVPTNRSEYFAEMFTNTNTAIEPIGIFASDSTPTGVINANPGSLCYVKYPAPNALDGFWIKATAADTSGWMLMGSESSAWIASQLEVDTGTEALKVVTPATLAAAKTVSQPPVVVQGGAFAFSATHIGAMTHTTVAGAQAATLPTLAPAVQAGRALLITVQPEAALNQLTITPGGASQIDNAGVGVAYVPTAGKRFQLESRDGLSWFSGTL